MTGYLLDTNVVSELRKPRPHGGALQWLRDLDEAQIYLSAVTLGELQAGVERTRQQDTGKAAAIESWIDELAASQQVLAMDTVCFREWARLMQDKSDHVIEDMMIAATARVHQLTLATRNVKDFARVEVRVVNPFSAR
jgi:predicted nucleic acid-binding protein